MQYFGLIALTPLEPSTSFTPHYAVPPSLCRRTLARCFAATSHALSLVSTRIPRYSFAVSPWDGSLAIRWTFVVSQWEYSVAIHCSLAVSERSLPAGHRSYPWGDFSWTSERWHIWRCLASRLFDSVTVTLLEASRTLECSLSFSHENVLVVCPFNWEALAWRKLWRKRLNKLHTDRRWGFPLYYSYKSRWNLYSITHRLTWEECGPCPVFACYTLAFALRYV